MQILELVIKIWTNFGRENIESFIPAKFLECRRSRNICIIEMKNMLDNTIGFPGFRINHPPAVLDDVEIIALYFLFLS